MLYANVLNKKLLQDGIIALLVVLWLGKLGKLGKLLDYFYIYILYTGGHKNILFINTNEWSKQGQTVKIDKIKFDRW